MAKKKTQSRMEAENMRENIIDIIVQSMNDNGYDILRTNINKLAMPLVTPCGGEEWLELTLSIPRGGREGDAYDGFSAADAYTEKIERKRVKK